MEKKIPATTSNKPTINSNANVSDRSGKIFLTISPVLPCLPAIPKRQKLQHRSHSTLSVSETEMPPCPGVDLKVTEDGVMQVHRLQKEKEKCPDRLHLDRRGLTSIPELIDEHQLRFLSLQHNQLPRIENLCPLYNLVYLDVYDNNLETMNGISELTNLRVLLMGKNRIRCIDGLSTLSKLEVLDLHGNQVSEINGLIALRELKVLNLASNLIRALRNQDLKGLEALQELNLRRNKIKSIMCFQESSKLNKLYLSNNDIQRLEDLNNIAIAKSLKEITIDGNPVSLLGECVSFLVSHLPNLHVISNVQVTDDMRKAAVARRLEKLSQIGSAKAYNKMDEHQNGEPTNKVASHNVARTNAEEQQVKLPAVVWSDRCQLESEGERAVCRQPPARAIHKSEPVKSKQKTQSGDYLIEINGRVLNIYGQGALRFVDRPWNPAKAGDVISVKLTHLPFESLVPVLDKIKLRFPNAEHFSFSETGIYCLGQLNALSDLQGLTSLTIEPEGNPIFGKEWRSYAIYRLSHWGLKVINSVQITESEIAASESELKGLSDLVIRCLPDSLLEPLVARLDLGQTVKEEAREWLQSAQPAVRSVVAKEALQWKINKREDAALKQKGKAYLYSIIDSAVSAILKLRLLREEWPAILHEIIRDTLVDYSHIDTYMKQCMSQIKL